MHQDEPRGIAHAVRCAREYVEGEPFALLFPDDLILGSASCVAELAERTRQPAGQSSPSTRSRARTCPSTASSTRRAPGNPVPLRGVVEKPRAEDAPSDLGIVGRYILGATIFEHIDTLRPGANGELQITDALAIQIAAGEPVAGLRYEGARYDTGRPLGYLLAQVAAGLARETSPSRSRPGCATLLGEGGHCMRLLAIGFPLPNASVDNYNPLTAPATSTTTRSSSTRPASPTSRDGWWTTASVRGPRRPDRRERRHDGDSRLGRGPLPAAAR